MFLYRAHETFWGGGGWRWAAATMQTREMLLTYTSTGVRPPWVTEQQIAPAKANLE